MITKTDLNWWLALEPDLDWHFATTYAEGAPHEYVAQERTCQLDHDDFVRAAHVIQTFGEPMKFYKWTRIYLTTPLGWKHWTMDTHLDSTNLVNRGRIEHVYGIQNQPRNSSGIETAYDGYASSWDKVHGMTDDEKAATADLIRATFGDKLRRTLDVGSGTGLPLDLGLVEAVRYVGIDPSTAMLNALVAKHPILAGVHPMTWDQVLERRVLCGTIFDTVLSLGGAASYITPSGVEALRSRSKRGALLMHYAPGEEPVTGDLDPLAAATSLEAVTATADLQTAIGRFVASVVR